MSMPSVFVSHGSPTLILENLPARDFLASLGALLPRPKAIVAVSAHWNTERPAVSTAERPETIVFLVSTYEPAEYEPKAAECGASAYIPKSSFGPDELETAWSNANASG